MREVAIVGAGELGGMIAYALACNDVVPAICLIDDHGRVAQGKALDISQAGPLAPFATTVTGSTDLASAAGADVVVVADPSHGFGANDETLTMVRRITNYAPRAVIVCAGADHCAVVERSVRELRVPRARVLGSAADALVAAAAAMVALEIDGSPRDVSMAVLGIPPSRLVIGWEHAVLGGLSLTRMLTEPRRRHLTRRIEALWPVGNHALAAAAVKVIAAIAGRSRRLPTCFVGPDDGAGARTRAAALPVRLGPSGITALVPPALTAAERVALDNAMLL